MPADATTILAAVAADLAALYPSVPVRTRKRDAANGKQLEGGWSEGFPLPCFVVSGWEPEEVDAAGTFETVSVGYAVLVEYVKAAEAAVPSGETPARGAEDSDVRDVRQAVRRLLYKPRVAGAVVSGVENRPRRAYEPAGGGKAVASGQAFRFEVTEARAE